MSIEIIPLERLIISFIPMALVIFLMRSWGLNYAKACYAIVRMLLQGFSTRTLVFTKLYDSIGRDDFRNSHDQH